MSKDTTLVPLSRVATFEMGQSPDSAFVNESGDGLPFLQGAAEFGPDHPEHRLYCSRPRKVSLPDDALISVRAPVGTLNRGDLSYCIGRGLAAVRFTDVIPSYGWHVLNYAAPKLRKVAQGSTFEAISKRDLETLSVANVPKTEQRRIAEILDTVDDAIRKTEELIAKLKQVKAGLLHDLLTRGIDDHDRLRDPVAHPEQFKDSPLGRIPREWGVKELETMADIIDPQPDHRTPAEVPNGVPYIGVGDFRANGTIDFDACRRVSKSALVKQQQRFSLESGDIIFGKIGTIGLPRRLPTGTPYALSANAVLIKPINPSFMQLVLDSGLVDRQVQQQIHSTSQPAFGIQKIRALQVPVPTPEEQTRLASLIDAYNARAEIEATYLGKLILTKAGLMNDLLTGQVRVTTVSDEALV